LPTIVEPSNATAQGTIVAGLPVPKFERIAVEPISGACGCEIRLHYQCRVRWQPNTLLVWDNRFLLHRGIHDFKFQRRHLVRTTVIGERPI
jgi:hypothetical protein